MLFARLAVVALPIFGLASPLLSSIPKERDLFQIKERQTLPVDPVNILIGSLNDITTAADNALSGTTDIFDSATDVANAVTRLVAIYASLNPSSLSDLPDSQADALAVAIEGFLTAITDVEQTAFAAALNGNGVSSPGSPTLDEVRDILSSLNVNLVTFIGDLGGAGSIVVSRAVSFLPWEFPGILDLLPGGRDLNLALGLPSNPSVTPPRRDLTSLIKLDTRATVSVTLTNVLGPVNSIVNVVNAVTVSSLNGGVAVVNAVLTVAAAIGSTANTIINLGVQTGTYSQATLNTLAQAVKNDIIAIVTVTTALRTAFLNFLNSLPVIGPVVGGVAGVAQLAIVAPLDAATATFVYAVTTVVPGSLPLIVAALGNPGAQLLANNGFTLTSDVLAGSFSV
ncbi:hypothetical protein M231_05345 [Tremella mesenterica]|uniref:Uncharacterized protein n=1 Tax=Tremella mesenterica TaxID=5217 RepID=A0A4Q1BI88_TREME|nr:hypothetical protein M231_05345 [Tremella mesenterica]